MIETLNELLSMEELIDGTWEIAVLKSYGPTLQAILGEKFPGSDVDLDYDPTEPTTSEMENSDYSATKTLREHLFIKRAERMIKEGPPMAAKFYEYLAARTNGRSRARSCL